MQARPKFRMTRKLQLPRTAGPSRYWLGPKMWLLQSTGWSATRSDKPPRIGLYTYWGNHLLVDMSAAKLKLALSSRSRFCTLTLQSPSDLKLSLDRSFPSNLPENNLFLFTRRELLVVSNNTHLGKVSQPRSREVATWSTFAGGSLPNFIFGWSVAPIFGLIFLEVPTYQAAEAETMLGDPSGEHRKHTSFCPFTPPNDDQMNGSKPQRFHLVPSTSLVHTRKVCQDSGWPSRDLKM